MRAASAWMLSGAALLLAGCGGATSGIVAIGPDMFAVETRGRVLANAVERGLTEATSFCMGQGRQTELLGTRINADNYQVAFRCVGASTTLVAGSAPIGRVPVAMRPSALGPVPLSGIAAGPAGGPVISGQAFAPPPPRQPGLEMGTVGAMPMQPAPVAGNPFAGSAPRVAPVSLAPVPPVSVPMAAPMASVPAVGLQPLQSPLGGAAPAPMAPPPAPVTAAPMSFEPPRFAEPPRSRGQRRAEPATEAPAFMPPPPAADPLQPLQSPLAGGAAAPAPSATPLPAAAPASAPVFQPLPPASGGLPQARSALQPVAAPR